MPIADVIGWLGAVFGTLLGVPQLVRLFRTRNVHGLSVSAWQAMVAVNLGWTVHGLRIGQAPQWVTSVLAGISTFAIVYLLAKQLRRPYALLLLPGVLFAGVMTLTDQLLGSAAYGMVALLPAILSNTGQTVALVRSRDVAGVSWLFLLVSLGNQAIWLAWAFLVADPGTIIAATTNGSLALLNVVWYGLRRAGLRSFHTLSENQRASWPTTRRKNYARRRDARPWGRTGRRAAGRSDREADRCGDRAVGHVRVRVGPVAVPGHREAQLAGPDGA